ncbi:MAG: beta-ketoacyl-[acyl-carrier-protein] synthase family protein [bacterium]
MANPRIVITGLGVVCPMARSYDEYSNALLAGRTCISKLENLDIDDNRFNMGGQIKDFNFADELQGIDGKRLLRFSQLALVAADKALNHSGLNLNAIDRDRIGTCFGTAVAGLGETVHVEANRYFKKRDHGVTPTAYLEFTPCACTTHIAINNSLRGPSSTQSSGCVTGIDALIWGVEQIRKNTADIMLVGGSDAPFFPFIFAGLYRSGLLSPDPSDGGLIPRPFSHDHAGIALVEGATAMIIEREDHARLRGAHIIAEVTGVASSEEALPMSALDDSGKAFAVTIKETLRDAGLPPEEIDWVCAHGTGFPIADLSESRGIESGLGDHAFCVPVSSIRGAVGQSFASGGGFQVAAACTALQNQMVPPTLNFSKPADGCRLDYVANVARPARLRRVLINAAGVGGTHAGAVISRWQG